MILLPKPPKIINEKDNWAVFEIEALHPGYGITIGNALRRVLLSSLPGAAIMQVKIKGVQHEFSTIPGVLEDVVSIVMNLKQLRFKIYTAEPQKATLKIKGEKEVKGSDFEVPSQMELINKTAHIATLTSKSAELEMEIQVESGLGYDPIESRKRQGKLEIGVIPVDAIFTPIKRVNYKVDNMRVGDKTDFDRLQLEITTDGTVTPEESFRQAVKILVDHFSLLLSQGSEKTKEEPSDDGAMASKEIKIEDFGVSGRTQNVLIEANIKTVGGLIRKSEKSLSEVEGMGEKGIEEIKKALKKLNLGLKEGK
jgi:DNA-directed RNA polymerase subunit alpha